jgi:uncharacterized damage-inducible protein DinB
MTPEQARALFDYNAWANHRILDACEALAPEQFTRDLRSSFGSVQGTLLHILGGEWFWPERWQGRSPSALDVYRQGFFPPALVQQWFGTSAGELAPAEQYPSLSSLRKRWEEVVRNLRQFVAGLSAEGVARVLHYTTTEGHPNSQPFWQMLQHVVNHGTHYRGQVTTLLRQLGAKTVGTDLILYYRERGEKPPGNPLDSATLRLLYEYNFWAHHRLLDSCAALTQEQFTRDLGSSFRSVRDTLAHIRGAEWVWLERWHGRSPTALPAAADFPTLADLRAHWAELEDNLLRFVNGVSAGELARVREVRTTSGGVYANALWQMMQHVVNHGTYHRGQAAAMLRQLGATPLFTDLIYFYRERAGQPLD